MGGELGRSFWVKKKKRKANASSQQMKQQDSSGKDENFDRPGALEP